MYSLWWYKPFEVEHVTLVRDGTEPDVPEIHASTPDGERWKRVRNMKQDFLSVVFEPLDNQIQLYTYSVFYAAATIFSGIHVVAWNWDFPSPVARILWRVFSLAATFVGLYSLLQSLVLMWRETFPGNLASNMILWVDVFLVLLYCGSRLGLVVLILYSFRSMPVGVYETVDWTTYFPYFS